MKKLFYLSIFSLFFLLNCQQENTKSPEKTEIKQLLENYYQTMSDRNWPAYKNFFAENATLTTIWAKDGNASPEIFSNSISRFLAQTKEGPDSQPIFEEKMLQAEIQVKQNLASAWVKYAAKFGSEDNLIEWKGQDLFSFIKFNNQWKIVSIVYESE